MNRGFYIVIIAQTFSSLADHKYLKKLSQGDSVTGFSLRNCRDTTRP